jgi:hypothetical protein
MKYKALMEGNKEATWLRSLIGKLGFLQLGNPNIL